MGRFLYPVDTDQFADIRKDGKVYVDKTDMVFDLVGKYRYVFLARPRRFGKSLLCNTFKAYFQGQKELFEGLKIAELEKEWKKYPVLHFTMSGLKNCTIPEAKSALELFIGDYEKIYGRNMAEETPGKRFRGLIHRACEQTGEKAVVILDEYDSAIMRLMYEPEQLEAMRTMLREFYQVLKDEGAYLRFVFITGVTKFSQLSIFSELNNLTQISMYDEYSGLCGITQEELDTVLRPCVEEYARNLEITTDEAYALLKKNYDGYHFARKRQDVYAPFSVLRAFDGRNTDHYWFESGTMTSLIEHLRHYPLKTALQYDGVKVGLDEFNISCESASTPIPLLYQTGYLTIKAYDKETESYTLGYPNKEVRNGFLNSLLARYNNQDPAGASFVIRFNAALRKGNVEEALSRMQSFLAAMPNDLENKTEKHYQTIIYLIFSLLGYYIRTEEKSAIGRADAVCWTDNSIYVFEFKVDSSAETALKQIDDKGYMIPFRFEDGKRLVKVGVNISTVSRTLEDWKIDVVNV